MPLFQVLLPHTGSLGTSARLGEQVPPTSLLQAGQPLAPAGLRFQRRGRLWIPCEQPPGSPQPPSQASQRHRVKLQPVERLLYDPVCGQGQPRYVPFQGHSSSCSSPPGIPMNTPSPSQQGASESRPSGHSSAGACWPLQARPCG